MIPCDIHQKNIHLALDGELNPVQQAELLLHLAGCANCRDIQKNLTRVSKAVAWATRVPANFDLPAGFQNRFWERLDRTSPRNRPTHWSRPLLVAAAVVLMVSTWQVADRWKIASLGTITPTPFSFESDRLMLSSVQGAISEVERNQADQESQQLLGNYL
ncbi:MAG: zf-HC2 domain-containing protein [Elusimicrobia bacterium]|nr:zf-HC2 domain-containing protein [Elusimicrobiota bacterium]